MPKTIKPAVAPSGKIGNSEAPAETHLPADAPATGAHGGLSEHAAKFQTGREESGRFGQSVRLQRLFALIEDEEQRQIVIRLAEALAHSPPNAPKGETN